jgi:hypothetical protein
MPGPPRGRPTRGVKASIRARATVLFSFLLALLGIALIIETAALGGGLGFVLGGLFVLAGILRLYLSLR